MNWNVRGWLRDGVFSYRTTGGAKQVIRRQELFEFSARFSLHTTRSYYRRSSPPFPPFVQPPLAFLFRQPAARIQNLLKCIGRSRAWKESRCNQLIKKPQDSMYFDTFV